MGSYLSEPETEKISTDEANDKLKSGASSMQGWRDSQEDAHNCVLDFDVNTSLFAVYDGHGGHEVAQYCSENLPQYIKDTEAYKSDDIENALINAFLGFDGTIITPKVLSKLKQIVSIKEGENDSENSDVEENVNNLYEEATMPLEQVIEKYTANLKQKCGKQPMSPCLRARKDPAAANEACSSVEEGSSSSKNSNAMDTSESTVSSSSGVECTKVESSSTSNSSKSIEENGPVKVSAVNSQAADSSNDAKESRSTEPDKVDSKLSNADEKGDRPNQNGEVATPADENTDETSKPAQENGEISKKGKGKALAKTKGVATPSLRRIRPKRSAQQLYSKLLEFESESDSEDEEDKTFQGPNEESSSEEDGEEASGIKDDSEASSDLEDEDDPEEEDLDDLEEEDDDDDDCGMSEADLNFAMNMCEEPGYNSGCTAVVAVLKENQLYVANAGDSRCIVCRNGKAIEMSIDHKPEDKLEKDRVKKAGGSVSCDGRINGGLNLSRAIGDHRYKQKKELSDREQMITALPDVRTLTINPGEDEFMVLACDGIWNSMSSQQVVDFVRPRIQKNPDKLSTICEEMFDHCLSPDTLNDGTGCDNMTAIIVQFESNLCKRAAPSELEQSENLKRRKTDENLSQPETTA